MSIKPRKITFFGLKDQVGRSLEPHDIECLPKGLESLLEFEDIFDADLVVIAPERDVFALPDDEEEAFDLHDYFVSMISRRCSQQEWDDQCIRTFGHTLTEAPEIPAAGSPCCEADTGSEEMQVNQRAARKKVYEDLIKAVTLRLHRIYSMGRAGPQDVIVFVPPSQHYWPYEPYATATLMSHWLGLEDQCPCQCDLGKRLLWTPKAEEMGWPSWFALDRVIERNRSQGRIWIMVEPTQSAFEKGQVLFNGRADRELKYASDLDSRDPKTPPWSETVVWQPLISTRDGSCMVAGLYTIGGVSIHILPEPDDVIGTVAKFVEARYGLDEKSKSAGSTPAVRLVSIGLDLNAKKTSLASAEMQAGSKAGMGRLLMLNGEFRVGIGETMFLQLLAFVAASRAEQDEGVDPTEPRIGAKEIRKVFRPADGYRGRYPRTQRGSRARKVKQTNPALPASEINELITNACKELKLVGENEKLRLIVSVPGKKGRYHLNPAHASVIQVALPESGQCDDVVKCLVDMVDRSKWTQGVSPTDTSAPCWYHGDSGCEPYIPTSAPI
jgi:hypothetical protein